MRPGLILRVDKGLSLDSPSEFAQSLMSVRSSQSATPPSPGGTDAAPADEPPQRSDPEPEPPAPGAARAVGPHIFLSPEQVVRRALFLAGVQKEDLISVAGPDGLAAMVSLCRLGYERVECARQATCYGADEGADLLLIVGPMAPDELVQTIGRTARLLKDGGVLIAQLVGPAEEAAIRPTLAKLGFEAQFSLIDRSAGRLVTHTVRRVQPMRKVG